MTKTERIKQLEDRVRELETTITEQAIRIGMLEARPIYPQWTYTTPEPVMPQPWYRPIDPYCTCGTSAVCPLHGMTIGAADILPGTLDVRIS